MATKRFCDICGEPAIENNQRAAKQEIGPARNQYSAGNCVGTVRTKIVVVIIFRFEDHETGYGGPPDLCVQCAANLLQQLKLNGTPNSPP